MVFLTFEEQLDDRLNNIEDKLDALCEKLGVNLDVDEDVEEVEEVEEVKEVVKPSEPMVPKVQEVKNESDFV